MIEGELSNAGQVGLCLAVGDIGVDAGVWRKRAPRIASPVVDRDLWRLRGYVTTEVDESWLIRNTFD
jgi:hypothetical protein